MNNFTLRLIFGLLYAIVVIFGAYLGNVTFYLVFFVFMIFCLYEFLRLIDLKSGYPYLLAVASFLSAIISNEDAHTRDNVLINKILFSIIAAALYFSFISALISSRKISIQYLGKIFLSLIYIILPFSFLIKIPYLNVTITYDYVVLIGIFVLIWSNDVFAYLIGKNFGKHKLIERVSPNKTVEGFIGGFVFTYIAGFFISVYCDSLFSYQWLGIAIIVSVFGVLGDLIESMFKRQAGVKDSSNFIPGHGGFLDRLDSIIFATPFIFIYLYLTA
jgi:phosphatidate cytidylyltransferase